jgi:hypothetical protein
MQICHQFVVLAFDESKMYATEHRLDRPASATNDIKQLATNDVPVEVTATNSACRRAACREIGTCRHSGSFLSLHSLDRLRQLFLLPLRPLTNSFQPVFPAFRHAVAVLGNDEPHRAVCE